MTLKGNLMTKKTAIAILAACVLVSTPVLAAAATGKSPKVQDHVCVTHEDCYLEYTADQTADQLLAGKKSKKKPKKSLMELLGCEVEIKIKCSA